MYSSEKRGIPEELDPLFGDVYFLKLDLDRHRCFIVERILNMEGPASPCVAS